MKVIWISRINPFIAKRDLFGAGLYSRGLIRALSECGVAVKVIGYDKPVDLSEVNGNIEICHVDAHRLWRGFSLLSALPSDAFNQRTAKMRQQIICSLTPDVDAVVIEYFATGWVLDTIKRCLKSDSLRHIKLIYVSHNCEAVVRPMVAREYKAQLLKRAIIYWDGQKSMRLERKLVSAVDIVTAITDADRAYYYSQQPTKTYLTLLPGFSGVPCLGRDITSETPRRVLMIGALEWIAKQENLRRFVAAAERVFFEKNIELAIVGIANPKFIQNLTAGSKVCRYYGHLDDITQMLHSARIGLMPDEIGGGFKFKYLDYLFNGLPVATIRSQAVGLPLSLHEAMIFGDNAGELAANIASHIDDVAYLNRIRHVAYDRCVGEFGWAKNGVLLKDAIGKSVLDRGENA